MALPLMARIASLAMDASIRLGIGPTMEKVVAMPLAERMAQLAPARLLGEVAEVPTEDVMIPTRDGVPILVRIYRGGGSLPLLYAHGGGFAIGGVGSCDHMCRQLAVDNEAVVVSVSYRLAPEHPFPVPLDDVEDALHWLLAADLSVDPARLVIGGDSAGGNLAAALALRLRDRGTPVAAQLLLYPALDLTVSSPGVLSYKGLGLKHRDLASCASHYLNGHDATDPYASPLLAEDLSGLAPAFILTCGHDVLKDDGRRYALRLREAGVSVEHLHMPDHCHASLSVPKLYRGIAEVYTAISMFLST
ncbi:MAG: Esterase/lipase/thioesterase [Frankiales bacterium]|nr:Esterase/lipase/thioesterase [Frankiales bacterium]